jgi:hypothetical protein
MGKCCIIVSVLGPRDDNRLENFAAADNEDIEFIKESSKAQKNSQASLWPPNVVGNCSGVWDLT